MFFCFWVSCVEKTRPVDRGVYKQTPGLREKQAISWPCFCLPKGGSILAAVWFFAKECLAWRRRRLTESGSLVAMIAVVSVRTSVWPGNGAALQNLALERFGLSYRPALQFFSKISAKKKLQCRLAPHPTPPNPTQPNPTQPSPIRRKTTHHLTIPLHWYVF